MYTLDDTKLSQTGEINVYEQRGAFMVYFDILLVAIACVSTPLIVAIILDIFYAEKKTGSFFITSYISMVFMYVCFIFYTNSLTYDTQRIVYFNRNKHLGVSEYKNIGVATILNTCSCSFYVFVCHSNHSIVC